MPVSYPFPHAWDLARYPAAYLRMPRTERMVQADVMARLRAHGAMVWPVDVGERLLRGRMLGAARRAGMADAALFLSPGRSGVGVAGLADLIGCAPDGRLVAVEVKRPAYLVLSAKTGRLVQAKPAGQPTEQQLAFLDLVYRRGAIAGVAWSGVDVDAIWHRAAGDPTELETGCCHGRCCKESP